MRPSGISTARRGLEIDASGHEYEVRLRGIEIWMLDAEKLVGYASGDSISWHVLLGDDAYSIKQPKSGASFSKLLDQEGTAVGDFRGDGLPLRRVTLEDTVSLTAEQRAFLVMVALLGWREGDRQLLGNSGAWGGGATGSGDAGGDCGGGGGGGDGGGGGG